MQNINSNGHHFPPYDDHEVKKLNLYVKRGASTVPNAISRIFFTLISQFCLLKCSITSETGPFCAFMPKDYLLTQLPTLLRLKNCNFMKALCTSLQPVPVPADTIVQLYNTIQFQNHMLFPRLNSVLIKFGSSSHASLSAVLNIALQMRSVLTAQCTLCQVSVYY